MTPCRWANCFRRFGRRCCLNVRGPAVRADLSTDTADEATAIVGTATKDQGSHPTVSAPSLYKFLHAPFLRHICSLSHVRQFHIALLLVSATLNEHLRRQSRGLNLTAPFLISRSVLAIINCNFQVALDNLLLITQLQHKVQLTTVTRESARNTVIFCAEDISSRHVGNTYRLVACRRLLLLREVFFLISFRPLPVVH